MKKNTLYTGIISLASILVLTACTTPKTTNPAATIRATQRPTQTVASSTSPSATAEAQEKDIELKISTPKNNTTVNTAKITLSGMTVPNAEVFVNDIELKANAKGEFSTQITLDEGENSIAVAANDENGNAATEELTVTYEEKQ